MELLSLEQIDQLEQQIRENDAAKASGEAPPHVLTKEQMRIAVMSLRAQRGNVKPNAKATKGKATIVGLDIEGL